MVISARHFLVSGACLASFGANTACMETAEVLTQRSVTSGDPATPVEDAGSREPDANTAAAPTTERPPLSDSHHESVPPPDAAVTTQPPPVVEPLEAPPLAVGTGSYTTCIIINEDGLSILVCVGNNELDPIGPPGDDDQTGRGEFVATSGGDSYMCLLDSLGEVYCWGDNSFGQLGGPDLEYSPTPRPIHLPERVAQLSTGANHVCAIGASGNLYCWGDNSEGQLGMGDAPTSDEPTPEVNGRELTPVGEGPWISVSAGEAHTCGVRSDGTLFCWGRNTAHQASSASDAQLNSPRLVNSEHSWRQVNAGHSHSCGLRTDGTLWCWGSNTSDDSGYPLGVESPSQLLDPTPIGDGHYRTLTTQWAHACAISYTGELWCWGRNEEGQLGTGDRTPHLVPTNVALDAVQVAVGRLHTCMVKAGDILCTGSNESRQLGLPAGDNRTSFTSLLEEWQRYLELP